MKKQYGTHKVYKNLAMDLTVFDPADTFSLLQNDVKCWEKLKIDKANLEHAGYQLKFIPHDPIHR